MAKVKVKALTTTAGDYGKKVTGDVFEVDEQIADVLIERGTVEKTSEAITKPEPDIAAETGKPVVNPEAPEKGSGVTFTDKTREKQNITGPGTIKGATGAKATKPAKK